MVHRSALRRRGFSGPIEFLEPRRLLCAFPIDHSAHGAGNLNHQYIQIEPGQPGPDGGFQVRGGLVAPIYHSRAGSPIKLFVDFDSGPDGGGYGAYDLDFDRTSFNEAELLAIHQIWAT